MVSLHAYAWDKHDPIALYEAVRNNPYSLLFDSADRNHPHARYSFIAFHPYETIESKDGAITVTNQDGTSTFRGDAFQILAQRMAAQDIRFTPRADLPPFQGGAAGCFSYDLVRMMERLPNRTAPHPAQPDMAIGLYDQVIAFDHEKDKSWFITLAAGEKKAQDRFTRLQDLVAHHDGKKAGGRRTAPLDWQTAFTREKYEDAVRRIVDYIHEGDIFQANMSQPFTAKLPPDFDSFAHYKHLRTVNPAPFAAYMNLGTYTISSASPERFVHLQNRQVETRPIKGTRKRLEDPTADAAARADLLASGKDRAENVMIVDLLRNDLAKVCEDFSVDVPELCALESFATVHHLVSTVTGVLRADCTALDLLRACFPGGSITGAPKVRAMEIIEELEPIRRGPYCGTLGYIGFNGVMDTNIAIRTLIYDHDAVRFNAGGGIVAESTPSAEYQETLDKAAALLESFAPRQKGKTA